MIYKSYIEEFNSPLRQINGKVELLASSTEAENIEFTHEDSLKSIKIDRAGEHGKFFGFGIFQKTTINLIDKDRVIQLNDRDTLAIHFSINENDYINNFPYFYVNKNETKRDEKTNELTVVAYDKLNAASAHTFGELNLQAPYTIRKVVEECQKLLNISSIAIAGSAEQAFGLEYNKGANFEGTESLRKVLDAIAEATQTCYFLDNDKLCFRRLIITGDPVLTIDKVKYMELTCGDTVVLSDIASTTELGDNLTATTGENGVTQYVKDNPFWDLRDDRATLVENAVSTMGGAAITPFNCSWRGNFLLQPTDKIALITKDDATVITYLLDETITYNGGLSSKIQWEYVETDGGHSNPTTLGEAITQTFAKVDKANKQINIVASKVEETEGILSEIQVNTEGINASVVKTINDDIAELKKQASLAISEKDVKITIENEMANGANKVVTSSGFTFDDKGLTVDKADSEMKTAITENGMKVYKNDEAVLVANNEGVNAKNLRATTYLIVGNRSRFEDYTTAKGDYLTGCFWIGG